MNVYVFVEGEGGEEDRKSMVAEGKNGLGMLCIRFCPYLVIR